MLLYQALKDCVLQALIVNQSTMNPCCAVRPMILRLSSPNLEVVMTGVRDFPDCSTQRHSGLWMSTMAYCMTDSSVQQMVARSPLAVGSIGICDVFEPPWRVSHAAPKGL